MENDNIESNDKLIEDKYRIKKHIIDFIQRRITDQSIFESINDYLKVFGISETRNESKLSFDNFEEDELIIIESKTKDNWVIITTKRIIVFYENNLNIERINVLLDFSDRLLDCDWDGTQKEYEILEIETLKNNTIEFEIKTGIPCLLIINCLQRLFRLYSRDRK